MGRTSDAREKLLAVAFDLIHENSYGTVSVEHICTRAGVNKGSFYYFFKTKTDLVVAAYEEHWQIKRPDYERIISKEHPPLKRLALAVRLCPPGAKKRRAKYGHAWWLSLQLRRGARGNWPPATPKYGARPRI